MDSNETLCHYLTSIRESKKLTTYFVAGHEPVSTWRMTFTLEGCGADSAAVSLTKLCCIHEQLKELQICAILKR